MNFGGINHGYTEVQASLVALWVKKAPAMQETLVRFLGGEVPLEKEMATCSILLPGKSNGQRSLMGYSPCVARDFVTKPPPSVSGIILIS